MSAGLYVNDGGVTRKHKELYTNVGGVTRELKELWVRDGGGVARKIFSAGVEWHASKRYGTRLTVQFDSSGAFSLEYVGGDGIPWFDILYNFTSPLLIRSILIEPHGDINVLDGTKIYVNGNLAGQLSENSGAEIQWNGGLNTLQITKDDDFRLYHWKAKARIYLRSIEYGSIELLGGSGTIKND